MGLIANNEYTSFFNALMKISRQEGIKALYRGYFAYILAVILIKYKNLKHIDNILDECVTLCYRFLDDEIASYRL